MAATTSNDTILRFFYFAFACLLYLIWQVVDLLLPVALTTNHEHYERSRATNELADELGIS